MTIRFLAAASSLLLGLGQAMAQVADTVFFGGPIITMNDAAPRAEAIAIKDGLILAVGDRETLSRHVGAGTEQVDLEGLTMLPGFVDAHGHVLFGGLQAMSANMLAPPDGDVTDIASLKKELGAWADANRDAVDAAGVIIGFGYDNAALAERRHPTRDDLDEVSKDIPIMLIHQSGHLGAANSAALKLAGIDASTENPPGGIIRKTETGEPNGVLEEYAFFNALFPILGQLDSDATKTMAKAGTKLWARYGYTTAQDGRANPPDVKTMRQVGAEGGLPIDVVSYVDVLVDREFIAREVSQTYKDRFRVGGAKLTIDGSPQGFTAWRDRPYWDPVGDYPPGYVGYPAIRNEEAIEAVEWAYANDIQILTHANGEAASDLLIAAHRAAAEKHGRDGRRDVLIHGQFLREDQVDAYNALGIIPSLFPMHTFYWGDWHRDHTVGPQLAENISPTGWVTARGMRFTTHHDAPVAFPDSMRVLDATVNRRTRSGDILGPAQRVDVMTALKAMTIWSAYQHFEEGRKGSLEPGKLADLVILSDDPTAVDPDRIDEIEVVMTIKENQIIYQRQD